jgi:hypothetical protein
MDFFSPDRRKRDGRSTYCRACHNSKYPTKPRYRADQRSALVTLARKRARMAGVPCTITRDDLVIPSHCPVLGIPMTIGVGVCHAGSPTVDRLEPQLGYVPSNVTVISSKANRIKNNATEDELRAVLRWMGGRPA